MSLSSVFKNMVGLLLIAILPMCGMAQSAFPPNPGSVDNTLGHVFPYRGAYYDASKPGTGILLDMGSDGTTFLTYYNYTQTGAPLWYYLYGKYQPSDEVTRWTTGVIGTLAGNFTSVTGGQCLGCAYTPTTETPTNIGVNLVWVNSREVKMTIGSQSWDMVASPMDGKSEGSVLSGTWSVAATTSYGPPPASTGMTNVESMSFRQVTMPVVVLPGAQTWTALNPGAQIYVGFCGDSLHSYNVYAAFFTTCKNVDHYQFSYFLNTQFLLFWYDGKTNRFAMDTASIAMIDGKQSYVVGTDGTYNWNVHCDLYLQGVNSLFGRCMQQGDALQGVYPGGLYQALSLVKLPGNNVVIP